MIIKKLILFKYERLALNNIEYIEYTPAAKMQLILGTNGSGKSSILLELSPLPGNHAFYRKGGYKHIFIEFNNLQYNLKSSFTVSGNRYSFMVNDEELNPSGTITVYKDLVKSHFGITQELHDLFTGQTPFHEMSVSERRSWMMQLSSADYTYAFKYFNRLKDQLRDIQGSIKLQQARLVSESDKLLSPEQESIARQEIANLKQLIDLLLTSKQPYIDRSQLQQDIGLIEASLQSVTEQLVKHHAHCKHNSLSNDIRQIEQAIIDAKSTSLSLQDQSFKVFEAIQNLSEQVRTLEHTTIKSKDELDRLIDQLALKVTKLANTRQLNLSFDCPKTTLQALNTIREELTTIFSELPVNGSSSLYNRDSFDKTSLELRSVQETIKLLNDEQMKLIASKRQMEHQRDHDRLTCPECKHQWSRGYDEATYIDICSAIDKLAIQADQLNSQQVALEQSLEAHRSYSSLIKQFRGLSYHWSILDPLWAYMAAESIVYDNPRYVLQLIGTLERDLLVDVEIAQLNNQITEQLKVKELVTNNQELDIVKLQAEETRLQELLSKIGQDLKETKSNIEKYESYKTSLLLIEKNVKELEDLMQQRDQKTSELLMQLKQQALSETIRILQLELNQKEQLISKIDLQKGIIDHLTKSIEEMGQQQTLLKIAIKELSPTEGLIAKGLTSFINSFVKQINAFIAKVWLYPLELIPIPMSDEEGVDLDYKFSVKINDTIPISDISKGSTAMREIIDLAFQIVSMQFLNMDNYPVILDELGRSMDPAHRQSAFYVVSQLLTASNFSQVFLVSHYQEMFGSLRNADITILSPSNISIPKESVFNQCVVMR